MSSPASRPSNVTLTENQTAIVCAPPDRRMLVLAGPGTGKTEVLARRLVHLLGAGLNPSQLLVLSFSRNAVRNVADRVRRLSDLDETAVLQLRHLVVRTFDSWSFRVLRQCGESTEDLLAGSYEGNIAKLVAKIRGDQRAAVSERLRNIRHVIVDELQDLAGWRGELVMELLKLLCPPIGKDVGFTLLGDPAQAIYGFSLKVSHANASVFTPQALLEHIRKTYKVGLTEECLVGNFRSKKEIAKTVDKARAILLGRDSAEQKLDKLAKIVSQVSETALDDVADQAENRKLAILCQTNGQALKVANELYGHSELPPAVPIEVAAGSPAKSVSPWIGATLGRFSNNLLTKTTFAKIYEQLYGANAKNHSGYGVPPLERAWEQLKAAAQSRRGQESVDITILRDRLRWPDLFPDDEGVLTSSIEVTTVHQSKGLEYDDVRILREDRNEVRDSGERDDGGFLEEANVLFVALSRASNNIGRLDGAGYNKLRKYEFGQGDRVRWCDWWGTGRGCQIEVGLPGDVSPPGFVSRSFFDSKEVAGESQAWLAKNADRIRGHKVVLVKKAVENSKGKFIYHIHLQENKEPTRFLGIMRPQLTFDLLSVFTIYGRGQKFSLPARIFNLRIAEVVSMSGVGEQLATVHEPWNKSGLWCGVRIHGLGYFKPSKRNS